MATPARKTSSSRASTARSSSSSPRGDRKELDELRARLHDRVDELGVSRLELQVERHRRRSEGASLYLVAIGLALAVVVIAYVSGRRSS